MSNKIGCQSVLCIQVCSRLPQAIPSGWHGNEATYCPEHITRCISFCYACFWPDILIVILTLQTPTFTHSCIHTHTCTHATLLSHGPTPCGMGSGHVRRNTLTGYTCPPSPTSDWMDQLSPVVNCSDEFAVATEAMGMVWSESSCTFPECSHYED